ncbi:MAG: hypothetical protein KatS3mg010_1132 [Acidimicrobiia bacterium]|nr:MAG: hypothetical protein KatS3mg010_1132 [Acidimicrobiia bacterium]
MRAFPVRVVATGTRHPEHRVLVPLADEVAQRADLCLGLADEPLEPDHHVLTRMVVRVL